MLQLAIAILIAISFTGVGLLISKYIIKPKITGSTSDGYHTFDELYYYRLLYNANLINTIIYHNCNVFADFRLPINIYKSYKHSNGEPCFGGGWFVVVMETPFGQITNHYENKYWCMFCCQAVDVAPLWDGHTPQQAAERLDKLNNYIINNLHAHIVNKLNGLPK